MPWSARVGSGAAICGCVEALVGVGVGGGSVMKDLRCMSLRNCGRCLSWAGRAGSESVVREGGREVSGEERRRLGRRLEDRVALAVVAARGGGRGSVR